MFFIANRCTHLSKIKKYINDKINWTLIIEFFYQYGMHKNSNFTQ